MDTKAQLEASMNRVGKDVKVLGRNLWLAGLGAVGSVDETGRNAFSELVARGEKMDGKVDLELLQPIEKAGERVKAMGEDLEQRVEVGVSKTLRRLGVPARGDVQMLIDRVEKLTEKVDGLARKSA